MEVKMEATEDKLQPFRATQLNRKVWKLWLTKLLSMWDYQDDHVSSEELEDDYPSLIAWKLHPWELDYSQPGQLREDFMNIWKVSPDRYLVQTGEWEQDHVSLEHLINWVLKIPVIAVLYHDPEQPDDDYYGADPMIYMCDPTQVSAKVYETCKPRGLAMYQTFTEYGMPALGGKPTISPVRRHLAGK